MNGATDERMVRATYLGSSDIAAVLGIDKHRTALDVWLAKREPELRPPPSPELLKLFKRGKRFEPIIRETALDELGLQLVATNERYTHPNDDFMRAEVDFEVADPDSYDIINCEAKSVHPSQLTQWGDADTDQIPAHYYAQVMWALACSNRNKAYVFALFGSDQLVRYVIERDDEIITAMIESACTFWYDCVIGGVEPAPQTIDDAAVLLDRWKKGLQIVADSDVIETVAKIGQLKAAIKSAEDDIDTLETKFAKWVVEQASEQGNADAGKVTLLDANLRPMCTWNKQRGAYLDQRGLKAEHPDLVTRFTVSHEYRVLRIN